MFADCGHAVNTVLLWWGVVRMLRALRLPASGYNAAKGAAVMALTLSLTMWLVAFLSVGAEWFLMWQSHVWDGREEAFRMFAVVGLVLLIVLQQDGKDSREGRRCCEEGSITRLGDTVAHKFVDFCFFVP